jgi:hypothetical protein
MMNVYMLKHLMDIDEWASSRKGYSYSMSVNEYGVSFWVFNHRTGEGVSVRKAEEIDEKLLEGVLCEA